MISLTPEEFFKYKIFISTKPSDRSRAEKFKPYGAPYWWCNNHNRIFKQGCERFKGYATRKVSDNRKNFNPTSETTSVSSIHQDNSIIDPQGMSSTIWDSEQDGVLTIPET